MSGHPGGPVCRRGRGRRRQWPSCPTNHLPARPRKPTSVPTTGCSRRCTSSTRQTQARLINRGQSTSRHMAHQAPMRAMAPSLKHRNLSVNRWPNHGPTVPHRTSQRQLPRRLRRRPHPRPSRKTNQQHVVRQRLRSHHRPRRSGRAPQARVAVFPRIRRALRIGRASRSNSP